MTKDEQKNIFFHNVYYMLSYAFLNLREETAKRIDGERFSNAHDLMAEIIFLGLQRQIKRGLYRQYEIYEESVQTIKGKILFGELAKSRSSASSGVPCRLDEFTEDNLFNQIVKATIVWLVHSRQVARERKINLQRLLVYLVGVSAIDVRTIPWRTLVYQRNNGDYRMLINVCRLVIEDLILSTTAGEQLTMLFSHEAMERIYERFLLNYYKKEHPSLSVGAKKIDWNIDEGAEDFDLLPEMKTDVTITDGHKTLIIDAKYHADVLQQSYFGKPTYHSGHIYQISAYVENLDKKKTGDVSGVVLYAKPGDAPDLDKPAMPINGNRIALRTLDLNTPFEKIKAQLDSLLTEFLIN